VADLAPPDATPLDPHDRRAEWELALLVLALMAAPGGGSVVQEGSVVAAPRSARGTTGARRARAAGRLIRPPRGC
jgi:hypothetical protein